MSMMRRYAAALVAASALTLGACGSEAPTVTENPGTEGAVFENPRIFSLNPATVTFTRQPGDPLPTGPQWSLVQGIIAAAGYPQFGAITWGAGASNWFDRSTTPMFSNLPALGWNFSFRLNQNAASLPEGIYEAWIPVNVPAALNNPQMLRVVYDYCPNCIRLGSVKMASLGAGSPTWDRGSNINAAGNYKYYDWRLFVEPGQTVYVQHIGNPWSPCSEVAPMGTQSDPYLYLFSTGGTFLDSDDDSCGYNSELQVTNASGTTMEYTVRSTQYCHIIDCPVSGGYLADGTFTIRVVAEGNQFFGGDLREGTPEEAAQQKAAHFGVRP